MNNKMSELINRSDLIESLNAILEESDGGTPIVDSVLEAVKSAVEKMPAVVCHCDLEENEELICRIMDYDAAGEFFPSPEVAQGDCTDIRLMNDVLNGLEEMLSEEIETSKNAMRDDERSKDSHLMFQGAFAAYKHCFEWIGEHWKYEPEVER